MDVGRLESLLFEKHVVKAGQDHTGHDNDSTFVSAAFLDTVILNFEIRVLRVFDWKGRCKSRRVIGRGDMVSASWRNGLEGKG